VPAERRAIAASVADRIETEGLRSVADAVLPKAMPDDLWTDSSLRDRSVARWLSADPEGYAAAYRMLIDTDVSDLLPAIGCLVDVFAGKLDPFCTPEIAEAVTRPIRNRRYKVLDGGHFMHVQSPQILGPEIGAAV
jgi:3-oxoadipate enol-lactonase